VAVEEVAMGVEAAASDTASYKRCGTEIGMSTRRTNIQVSSDRAIAH